MLKLLNSLINEKSLIAKLLSLLFLVGIWCVLLIFSGAYNSGFHFLDDDFVMSFADRFANGNPWWETALDYIQFDLNTRFRTFYWVEYFPLVHLFGTCWECWAWYHLIYAIATSFLLFFTLTRLGFSASISTMAVLLILVGYQAEIFWRTSPAERIGIFMFAAALFTWLHGQKKRWARLLSVFFVILSCLSKESFLLTIPFLLLAHFFYAKYKLTRRDIIQFIRKEWIEVGILSIWFIFSLCIIVFFIGTNKIKYAGVESMGIRKFLYYATDAAETLNARGLIHHLLTFATDLKELPFVALGAFFLFLMSITSHFKLEHTALKTQRLTHLLQAKHTQALLLFLALYIPQYALYLKNTYECRYFLPSSIAFVCIILFSHQNLKFFSQRLVSFFFIFILTTQVVFGIGLTQAVDYAHEGRDIKELTTRLDNVVQARGVESTTKVLLLYAPTRAVNIYTWKTYLSLQYKNKLSLALIPTKGYAYTFEKELPRFYKGYKEILHLTIDTPANLHNYDVIITAEELGYYLLGKDSGINPSEKGYQKLVSTENGSLYIKK